MWGKRGKRGEEEERVIGERDVCMGGDEMGVRRDVWGRRNGGQRGRERGENECMGKGEILGEE